MKSFKYIWRNITRNKLRSILTVLSIGFSLALMTILYGYLAMQDQWGDAASEKNRIVVMNIQGFSGELPIAYVDRVRNMEHMLAAVPYSWFGGKYNDRPMPFAQFGTDPQQVFQVWDELEIAPDQLKNWQDNRRGCVADRRLAAQENWQIGDRIRLEGTFLQVDLDLELVGTFDSPQSTDSLWFHWEYLDEGLKQNKAFGVGNAGTIFAKVADSDAIPAVIDTIDARFASSQNPTRTQTEAAFAQMFKDMLGNVQAYVRNIALAVIFSLSLVAANSMAMSMRERTTEIAVLKAIGFSQARVLWMVLGEACVIAMVGGALGVVMGCACLQFLHQASKQFFQFPVLEMLGPWLLYSIAAAALIGLTSGIVPAIRAAQLRVVDGLRQVV